jgi:putative endonuclease
LCSHQGFTARSKDWEVVYFESFELKRAAINREQEKKKWKSREKIIELISR